MMIILIIYYFYLSLKLINTIPLSTYNVDKSKISVSGISSGAAMANQLHVAYSSLFSGVGIVAGPPYTCSGGSLLTSSTLCMTDLPIYGIIYLPNIYNTITNYQANNRIDNISNLKNDRIYIYHGILDVIVASNVVRKHEDFYSNYVTNPTAQIKSVFNLASVHGFITNDYGYACGIINLSSYMNNCNYNQAYDILNHLYNTSLREPSKGTQATQELIEFDQYEFFNTTTTTAAGAYTSMANTAYVYVPLNCKNRLVCKLHVALHGCGMAGKVFALNAGYNQVADLNDIIIVYPQVRSNSLSTNPQGCWDWWGYTNSNYANKLGLQMNVIRNMIKRISMF